METRFDFKDGHRLTIGEQQAARCYKSETQMFAWIPYDNAVFNILASIIGQVQIYPQSRFISFCSELSNSVALTLAIL